mmetsp:Transcript_30499/g.64256  ORF Transcript_30499/g.64256 Transcript_30499/m.64256 type:complete len:426 (+) Transcript_30499:224-1501(+)|eukprot:CAMPEP_0171341800 /NCGR_PEP_ID=MMETSP0878-20121228/11877_1 /TAXON_ID=67004 /ORGANISM="Thalassiosira weissflogii, Strain CCMP1336" /LENGTH=425 /DNA_ID=CAMNT_0011844221 /DNA_START=153 /DNA_END=1430 /DNA_ORIENTATION=+
MGFTRQTSNVNIASASNPPSRCCDYKKLNIVAFAGALLYIGYLFGSMENSNDATFSNEGADERRTSSLRAATASSSWDRIWEESKSENSGDEIEPDNEGIVHEQKDVPLDIMDTADVVIEEPGTSYASGPVIYEQEGPVSTISLIGERHSGTNWITDHLEDCFGDQIKVETAFTRFKHWFQFDDPNVRNDSAVVIAMFRDPYDWVEAMRERPHHAHDHIDMEWKDFVTKPWVGPRGPADQQKLHKAKEEGRQIEYSGCLAGYKFDEVIPCSEADSIANEGYSTYMYELMHDGSSRAYGSIIDLRREKILNFMQVPKFHGVRAFFPERYEALNLRGTADFLRELEEVTGLKAKCEPFKGSGVVKHKEVDPDYVRWMNKFVDWSAEGMIGYVPREPEEYVPREPGDAENDQSEADEQESIPAVQVHN